MANETFYPPVTNLVAIEDLPQELGFVKDGLTDLLDNILYKDLQYSSTPSGDSAFYRLSIVSKKRIDIEIPGTGIFLVLNPSHDAATEISEFPLSLQYRWPVISYVGSLDLDNFSFQPADIFELALKIFLLSEKELIQRGISIFLSDEPTPIDTFVNQLNDYYGASVPVPTSSEPIDELLASMKNDPKVGEIGAVVFALFILDNVDVEKTRQNVNNFFSDLVEPDFETFFLELLKPDLDASFKIGAGLEFPRNVLLPVDGSGEPIQPDTEKVMLLFEPADFYFSTDRGIGYDVELNVSLNHNAQIGQTGLGISLDKAKLDFSKTTNIQEADQDGRPKDFVGAYIGKASISLPDFLDHDEANSTALITGKNLIIGTGGFSGTVGLEAKDSTGNQAPVVKANLGGGFSLSLDDFSLSFQQNAVIGSSIRGTLKIPGFKDSTGDDAEVSITAQITDGGNYSFTLSEEQGIDVLEIPDILSLSVSSLSLGESDGKFFVAVSGIVNFVADVPGLGDILPKGIEIKKLTIWEDGSLELEGGGVNLPKAVTLEAGPVKFSVTAVHFGTHKQFFNGQERTYRYFGFDGGLSVNPGGVDARGDGIKFYYTSDGLEPFDSFLRVEGIGINLTIPGDATPEAAAVILKGYLAMRNADSSEPGSKEYVGSVSLTLPKVNIGGSAAMRLNPDIPAFLVDVGLELSVPIMLGTTGLGIYGFRGLIGQKYMPSKESAGINESETWWYYYKSKEPDPPGTEGVNFGKFAQEDGFSLGAGVSLATAPDSGKTFSSKLFFLLGLPEVFLLQGQAAILKERIGLDDTQDPPFSALIAISPESVETAFGVNYKVPESGNFKGDILTLEATLEMAFFYDNPRGWYINIGRETPEEKRVQAKILSLFDGYSFLMLSASGIKAGAGVSWSFDKGYGPVSLSLGAYLDIGGQISFQPVQIGGFIQVGGYAHLSVFGFELGIDVSAGLAAECPKPFIITGYFKLKFKIKIAWFLTVSFKINVEFTWEINDNVLADPIPVIATPDETKRPAVATNIMSDDSFVIGYHGNGNSSIPTPDSFSNGLPVVPMDSFIDIEFLKAVKPGNDSSLDIIGGSRSQIAKYYKAVVPPEKGKSEQVHHEFTIESVRVAHWDGSQWKDYHIYEAVSSIKSLVDLDDVTVEDHTGTELEVNDLTSLNAGYWQIQQPNRFAKLRMLSQNMFSYHTDGAPGGISLEGQLFGDEDIFCEPALRKICINWEDSEYANTVFEPEHYYSFNGLYLYPIFQAQVLPDNSNPHGFAQSVAFQGDLNLYFASETPWISLKMTALTNRVIVYFIHYHYEVDEEDEYIEVEELKDTRILTASELSNPVIYDALDTPVNKVVIEAIYSMGRLNKSPLHIGASTPKITHFFQGEIDEVKVFDRELTPDHIIQVMQTNKDLAAQVAAWELNGSPAEISGRYNGQEVSTVKWDDGVYNQAALMKDNAYIQVPHHEELSFGETSFSVSAWIRTNKNEAEGQRTVVEKIDKSPIGLFGYSLLLDDGILKFDLAFKQSNRYSSEYQVADLEWHHIAVTIERSYNRIRFYVDGERVKEESLESERPVKGGAKLHEVCYHDYDEALEYEDQIGNIDVDQEIEEMENGLTKRFQPIWRPNTQFAIQLETRDTVRYGGSVQHDSSMFHTFVFRTDGTLGHFHKGHPSYTALKAEGREDEYKLSKLQHYIDYEKSYPNADGKLVNAKPVFYKEVELFLFFRHPYLYAMYSDWEPYQGLDKVESSLEVEIVNSEGHSIKQKPEFNFQTLEGYAGEDVDKINKFIKNGQNCTGTQEIKPFGLQIKYKMPDLDPEKLYTAVFNSLYKSKPSADQEQSEVHKYVFQTSRYGNFKEQIQSYETNGRKALFDWEAEIDTGDLTLAKKVVEDTLDISHSLVTQYADPYDRLMNGAMKLPALEVPSGTEINRVIDKESGKIIGLLIRNPEPFNDPKLPSSKKQQTVSVQDNNGNSLHVLAAKEPSRIFVTNSQMDLNTGKYTFTFKYFLYDGSAFTVHSQETIHANI